MTGPVVRPVGQLFDIFVSRPSLLFGSAAKLPKNVMQRARIFEQLATSEKRELTEASKIEQFLMPNGNVVTGGMVFPDLQKRLGIQQVMIGNVDQTPAALRELTGTIRMDWSQPNALMVNLPRRVTDEQVTHLSRYFDNNQIKGVQLIGFDGKQTFLNNPLGAQVEDAIYEATGKYATRKSRITPDLIKQYNETGVFKGQAGLLDDGTPVEIRSKLGSKVTAYDHTIGKEIEVDESKLQVLPTTLEDQFKPNNVFTRFLPPDELKALGQLRLAMSRGLGRPVKKFADLEKFAGSQGYLVERLNRGKVALVDMTSGERQQFENIGAATVNLRAHVRPAPDLTPDDLKELFGGETNIGFVGLNTRPPLFGELVPVPTNIVYDQRVAADKLPGAVEYIIKPMRGLFQSLQQRTGLPFGDLFQNIQTRTVLRQNWNARWIHGKGQELPTKIKSLDEIKRIAGRDADEEVITEWLESGADAAARARVQATMTKGELAAAQELRKWYDEVFKDLGIEADYLENYAPHWRMNAGKYGNDIYEIWRATRGKDPLPKGAQFFADYYRTGMIDVYDTKAFRIASRYAHAGSSNRFMKEPLDQVSNFLQQVPDRALTKPMSEYLMALRGFEFIEQKQMIERTLETAFGKLPGLQGAIGKGLADKLSDLAIGMGYMSTLAFRFPSVLRNYTQIFQTTYAIFGSAGGAFAEGIGRAATRAGKLAAVEDGVISYKSASVFGRQEFDEAVPVLKKFSDLGFKMYDNADEFTRAASYWVARENASRAIARYARKADAANPARARRALEDLLLESKVYMFEDNIKTEFLRRMTKDPELAARYIGKQMSDVTQFLYGRGMQPYWMRSVWGKFFGQYGTWSLWYMDYLTRTVRNLRRNGQTGEAIKFVGRNAMVNAAFLYAGHEVLEVDLARWLAYPSIFYSGGPGAQVVVGATYLFRGLADKISMSESEFAQSHVTQGINTIINSGLAFIPFRSAARDMQRINEAVDNGIDYTELLASMLGTRPTKDYTVGEQLDAMFPGQALGYEEWMRYDGMGQPRPAQPSASAATEIELYRRGQQTSSSPHSSGSSMPVPGSTPGTGPALTGRPPSREQMGLTPVGQPPVSTRRTTETRRGGLLPIPPTTESEPLDR